MPARANRPRVHYPWNQREEFADGGGMWRQVTRAEDQRFHAERAALLMANPDRFRSAMRKALTQWPRSCETSLTATNNNQRAWLGHAGCWLEVGSPEECTRLGWHQLD